MSILVVPETRTLICDVCQKPITEDYGNNAYRFNLSTVRGGIKWDFHPECAAPLLQTLVVMGHGETISHFTLPLKAD